MTLTRALVEILLSPYPEAQSTGNILDSRSECQPEVGPYVDGALNTGNGVGGFHRSEGRAENTAGIVPTGAPAGAIPCFGHRPEERGISDSIIVDRHGDDRFADNILRALEGLPQNGDDEEERAAAEEGALIEASNLPYPEYERNGI